MKKLLFIALSALCSIPAFGMQEDVVMQDAHDAQPVAVQPVTIKTSDGIEFKYTFPEDIAALKQSKTIFDCFDSIDDESNLLPLPNVTKEVWETIFRCLKLKHEGQDCIDVVKALDVAKLCRFLNAVDFLEIEVFLKKEFLDQGLECLIERIHTLGECDRNLGFVSILNRVLRDMLIEKLKRDILSKHIRYAKLQSTFRNYDLRTINPEIRSLIYWPETIQIPNIDIPNYLVLHRYGRGYTKALSDNMSPVEGVLIDPATGNLISWFRDRTIRIGDPTGGEGTRVLSGHTGFVSGVLIDSETKNLISWSRDGTIRIWDMSKPAGEECIRTLIGRINNTMWMRGVLINSEGVPINRKWVRGVLIDPKTRNLISWSHDETIKIWDLSKSEGQECIRTLRGHTNWVKGVLIDPATGSLISWSGATCLDMDSFGNGSWYYDETIRIWDPNSGKCIAGLTSNHRWLDNPSTLIRTC